MILIGTDSDTGIIVNASKLTDIQGSTAPAISVRLLGTSHLNKQTTVHHQLDDADFEAVLERAGITSATFFLSPDRFMFDGTRLIVRPTIKLYLLEEFGVQQDGTPVLPLYTDIQIAARCVNPDDVEFGRVVDVKIKDRNNFITTIDKGLVQDEFVFSIRSDFPGVSKLRAKDVTYKCLYEPLFVRFKQ